MLGFWLAACSRQAAGYLGAGMNFSIPVIAVIAATREALGAFEDESGRQVDVVSFTCAESITVTIDVAGDDVPWWVGIENEPVDRYPCKQQ